MKKTILVLMLSCMLAFAGGAGAVMGPGMMGGGMNMTNTVVSA